MSSTTRWSERLDAGMNLGPVLGTVRTTRIPPQGMTSTVTLFETDRGRFAIKRADRAPFIDWLRREAFVLEALVATNLPVPRIIALDADADTAALLMTALPGEPLSEVLRRGVSGDTRRDLLVQFGRMLAQVHASAVPVALSGQRPWLDRILDHARMNHERGFAEPGAQAPDDLEIARPVAMAEVLMHGDYTLDNVLVDGRRITGVIDWSLGDSGDRRYDLALACRLQEPENAFLSDDDFGAFYSGYGGARMSDDERAWFSALYEYF